MLDADLMCMGLTGITLNYAIKAGAHAYSAKYIVDCSRWARDARLVTSHHILFHTHSRAFGPTLWGLSWVLHVHPTPFRPLIGLIHAALIPAVD